jgi:class 3 adenylate cyclase
VSTRDEWEAAGIYDPACADARERLELLEWIHAHGVPLPEIVASAEAGQLTSIVGDRSLRPGPRMSMREVATNTGLDVEVVNDLRRATGMPIVGLDDDVYTADDLPMFELFAQAAQLFSRNELVHFTRVMGTAIRRVAEAAGEMFLRDVEAPIYEGRAGTPLEVAKANYEGIQLARAATGVFEPMFRSHLELATQSMRLAREGMQDYGTLPLSIGFVDLSGFTTQAGTLDPKELLDLVMTFESASIDLVSRHGGRLVKLIGDEVMFSTIDPDVACEIAAALVEQAASWANGARGGLAHGRVITSGGDLYGETVNLAARIVDIAVAGEVLVNEAVTERASGHRFSPAGRRQLKGFPEPIRLWSLDE